MKENPKKITQYDVVLTQTVTFKFEVRVFDCDSPEDAEQRAAETVNRWRLSVYDVDDTCDYDPQGWEAEPARPVTKKRKKVCVMRLDEEFLR